MSWDELAQAIAASVLEVFADGWWIKPLLMAPPIVAAIVGVACLAAVLLFHTVTWGSRVMWHQVFPAPLTEDE
jgi:hypothetical protein